MAQTVGNAFEEFNKQVVNLDPDRTIKARASRDWLIEQLNQLDKKEKLYFPFIFPEAHLKFGSFARNTKIRELDDIDLMLCLKADDAYYTSYGNQYIIHTEKAGERLRNLSDNNVLNSRKVIESLKGALSNISCYSKAELHRRGEAATLQLSSYEWNFDIVPCFYTTSDFYVIPDGDGNWKATDPRIDYNLVMNMNKQYDAKVLQLIRTLKYWNRQNSATTIPSYLFEQLVIKFIKSRQQLTQWIDVDIIYFFSYLAQYIYSEVEDPKGIQGNLNNLSWDQKKCIAEKAHGAYDKAVSAFNAETKENNQRKAINIWREIFGDKFPQYA